MALWIHGFMDVWLYGFMALWIHGFMESLASSPAGTAFLNLKKDTVSSKTTK
jgi:hypothetical protein